MSTEHNSIARGISSPPETRAVTRDKFSSASIFGMVLIAILGGAGSAWFVLQRGRQAEAAPLSENASAPKYLLHLEGFTVNLADPEETHFLRVTLDLGVDHLPPGSTDDKSTAAIPVGRVRDAILSVLTSCKADQLLTPDGKSQLKKNLAAVLQKQVPELGVREVYFTEFLVQR
jgi:flagellar protein FliL